MSGGRPNGNATIRAIGCCTSLGGAVSAAAAFRAGLSRSRELRGWTYTDEEANEEAVVVGHPVQGITDGFEGVGRLVRLATVALEDLARSVPTEQLKAARTIVLTALPAPDGTNEDSEGPTPEDADPVGVPFVRAMELLSRPWLGLAEQKVFVEGRTGFFAALRDAVGLLHAGGCDYCIVGGVDSWLGTERLEALMLSDGVKTANEPAALSPGEAAAYLLLARGGAAPTQGPPLEVAEPTVTQEPTAGPEGPPPTGRALADAALAALKAGGASDAPAGSVYPDLNGEPARARDWGLALGRLHAQTGVGSWASLLPATSFGDVGAASAPLGLCLAVRGFQRAYAPGRHALITAADGGGARGAVTLLAQA